MKSIYTYVLEVIITRNYYLVYENEDKCVILRMENES